MLFLLKILYKQFLSILKYFDDLCKPNPKYIWSKVEREVSHKKNKALLSIQVFLFVIFFLNLIFKKGSAPANLQGCVSTSVICLTLLISCRFHPQIFKLLFNLLVAAYGLFLTRHGNEGIHGAWLAAQTYPTAVYLITGSIWHFTINVGLQTIFLNTLYQDLIERSLMNMSPDDFIRSLTHHSHQTIMYNLTFIVLIHRVFQKSQEYLILNEKKRDEMERQKQFILSFTHELRNLANSIMGNVKLAALESIPDKVSDMLKNADVCAELLSHLINNILDTGKVEKTELEINPEPVRVYDTMERVWSICSELIRRKNLSGRMNIQKNIPFILKLDRHRLTQIFLNLVGNAVKFTDAGRIDISINWINDIATVEDKCFEPCPFNEENDQDEGLFEKRQAFSTLDENLATLTFCVKKISRNTLNFRQLSSHGVLKITVSDTGSGIPKEDIKKLFQKFTQVSPDISKRKLGTGLGLFITKELCKGMGGEVRIYSKEGKGSAFVLCIPVKVVSDSRLPLLRIESMRSIINLKDLKVLLIDKGTSSIDQIFSNINVKIVEKAKNSLLGYHALFSLATRGEYIDIVSIEMDLSLIEERNLISKIRELEDEKDIKPCLIFILGEHKHFEIEETIGKRNNVRTVAYLKKPIKLNEVCQTLMYQFARSTYGRR